MLELLDYWNHCQQVKDNLLCYHEYIFGGIFYFIVFFNIVSTFIYSNFVGYDIPYLKWTLDHETYTITAKTKILPTKAHAWHAPSCTDCNGINKYIPNIQTHF